MNVSQRSSESSVSVLGKVVLEDDCSTWPGLSRLLVPQSDILDWGTVLYQGPGKVVIHPTSVYYRPFHVTITSNKDSSVLRIQRFEYRSPASVLSLGLLGIKDIEPKDSHPISMWYMAATPDIAKMMLILDVCQTIRNDGVKRGQRQFSISRMASALTPAGILPLQNYFQLEFTTHNGNESPEKVILQICDEETDQGCSKLLERIGRHLRHRQLPLYPHCLEWALLQDTIRRVHCRMIYNPAVCQVADSSYIQPDGHYEEMIVATAPDLARRLLGYPNPHLCVLGYRKEKLICIQLFHTSQSMTQCHEQPDKKFPKQEIWIGADEAFPAFIRLLRIFQVIEGGGSAAEYGKRVSSYSAERFLRAGQLPTSNDRVFVLPLGHGAKLEFGFVQFSGDSVGYSRFASQIDAILQEIVASCRAGAEVRDSRNRPPSVIPPSSVKEATSVDLHRAFSHRLNIGNRDVSNLISEVTISIPEQLQESEETEVKRSVSDSERWAWATPRERFPGDPRQLPTEDVLYAPDLNGRLCPTPDDSHQASADRSIPFTYYFPPESHSRKAAVFAGELGELNQMEESLDDILGKAALRQAQIQRLKKAVKEESREILGTSVQKETSVTDSRHAAEPHLKKVFESLSDQYRSVDEEDSHTEPSSSSAARHPRSNSASKQQRSPQKSITSSSSARSSSHSTVSPTRKREHETSAASPRPISKAMRPETLPLVTEEKKPSAGSSTEPTELSLQERRALFEKPAPAVVVESLSVQDKKAMFEKAKTAPSPKKSAVASPKKSVVASPKRSQNGSPKKVTLDPVNSRRALFQEAATKAQDPTQPGRSVVVTRRAGGGDVEMKSPEKKKPEKNASPEKSAFAANLALFQQEQPKEVGVFTRTLQDKLLVQTKAWKHNDVARKIDEQKEEDMKVLKKRWELMAEEERRAAGRQAEIEELLERQRTNAHPPVDHKPPPLPLPGSSALHETTLKTSILMPSVRQQQQQQQQHLDFPPPPPPHMLSSPVYDAVARFENPNGKSSAKEIPPTPPPPPPFTATPVGGVYATLPAQPVVGLQRRPKLPEELGVSTASENSDNERYEDSARNHRDDTYDVASSSRQKRSVGPKSPSAKGRVVSWSPDASDDEDSNHHNLRNRSPQQKRSATTLQFQGHEEFERYTYVHELHDSEDARSEGSSVENASVSSSITQPISLSFYRKAQKESGSGVKRVVQREEKKLDERSRGDDTRRRHLMTFYQQKIDALYGVSSQQQAILVQTTSALNLCRTAPEFQGSIERAECERLLLLAAKKRDACHMEINRLKKAITEMKQGQTVPDPGCHGQVIISSILMPTKEGFADYVASDDEFMHYFVVLIKHREKVWASQMINSVQHLQPDGTFALPNGVTFDDLENDFVINVEVYAVQARRETVSHEEKYHIKDASAKKKEKSHTLKKLLPALKDGSASHMTAGTPSKQDIRLTSFGCIGVCVISLQNVHEGIFALSKVPETCALEGTLDMKIACGVSLDSTEEGFLSIFEDSCGAAAWHRRWCVLKNDCVLMWKYPEEIETVRPRVLNLRTCRGQAELANSSVCIRPHTFQMMLSKPLKLTGADPREPGPYKYFLSADGKEERFMWQEKLNKVLSHIRAWIPNEVSAPQQTSSSRH
ncbi:putative Actin-binding protein anillin [Hypsibius exemplaris]|uniref:Actin-binding protein anillin n=1 Tax=Hypsibius exemplaris TaxID=2072580 RepID=A0A9X6RLI4_HYPEX|nr:putative Actin-binding protein anillin [Hypsibius exemplaris]